MIPCTHWRDIKHPHGGFCKLHGMTISLGVCRACKLGDGKDWPPDKLPGRRPVSQVRFMNCRKAREQRTRQSEMKDGDETDRLPS